MKLQISEGNSKLGKIPNFSLEPAKTCKCRVCFKQCYARRIRARYKNVKKAWQNNYKLIKTNVGSFYAQMNRYLALNRPKYFRIHVGGDIPDSELGLCYWFTWKMLAILNPETKFLMYTKNTTFVVGSGKPDNLIVVLSRWPGDGVSNTWNAPQAWFKPKKAVEGYEIPADAIKCKGSCINCKACFNMKLKQNVYFEEH